MKTRTTKSELQNLLSTISKISGISTDMRIYSKCHESSKALKSHISKIKEKGGQVSLDGQMVIYYSGKPLKKGSIIIPYPKKEKYTIESVGKQSNIIDYWVKENGKYFNYLLNSKDNIVKI